MAVGMLTALLTQALSGLGKVPEDASMGVVFTSLFAVGVILITNAAADVDLDPGCVLYGLIELAPLDTGPVFGRGGAAVARHARPGDGADAGVRGPALEGAEARLVRPGRWRRRSASTPDVVHYALMAMVAGVTVAAFEAVGSILVVAMLIVPGGDGAPADRSSAAGCWLGGSAWRSLSAAIGYRGAVALNSSVAGMMAVVAGGLFALAVRLRAAARGARQAWHTLVLSLRIAREDVLARLYRAEEGEPRRGVARDERRRRGRLGRRAVLGPLALRRLRLRGQVRRRGRGGGSA